MGVTGRKPRLASLGWVARFILRGQQDGAVTCGGDRWSWAVAGKPSRGFDSPRSQCLRWFRALLSGRRSRERLTVLANTGSVLSGGLALLTNLLVAGYKFSSLHFAVGGLNAPHNLLVAGYKFSSLHFALGGLMLLTICLSMVANSL